MYRQARIVACSMLAALVASACSREPSTPSAASGKTHAELLTFLGEWRSFQKPKRIGGVPDYSAQAMTAQHRELARWQSRLAAFDTTGWSIADQVDYQIIRAEMNGLDFDHRVLKPWVNNPAFYVTVFSSESDQPAREGPIADGTLDFWQFAFPLSSGDAATVESGLKNVPDFLAQARVNLTGNGKDLWTYGAAAVRDQSGDLAKLASLTTATPTVKAAASRAQAATDSFATWIDGQLATKTGPSGVGVDNYNWYLKNVQLVPYTWRDEVTLMERELARSSGSLLLEEARNTGQREPAIVSSAEEHARRFNAAITEYMRFLEDHRVLTVKPWMDSALRKRIGRYSTAPREFFTEVDYRDPVVMRTHGYHWFDKGWMRFDAAAATPIRREPLLYNIFNTRTEGHATAWEELMMQAGMFDSRPRSRELIYILVAERAARALGDLRMHSNEYTLEQASEFASANTPRGWLSLKGNLVRGEQHLYLQQPGYGTSYVVGKLQVDRLMSDRKRQLGDAFTLKRFMDEFNAVGLIPISLVRWQLTGELAPDVKALLTP